MKCFACGKETVHEIRASDLSPRLRDDKWLPICWEGIVAIVDADMKSEARNAEIIQLMWTGTCYVFSEEETE